MAKSIQKSPLLGEFLRKNNVLTQAQLREALQHQKRVSQTLTLLSMVEVLLGPRPLEKLIDRLIQTGETHEEAIFALGLFTREEFDNITSLQKAYRVPLGIVLYRKGFLGYKEYKFWLKRFDEQKFSNTKLLEMLKKLPLFEGVTEARLKKLCPEFKYKYYEAGDFVFRKDDASTGLYIVESGLIRLSYMLPGGRMRNDSVHHGDYFGLPGAVSANPRIGGAQAILNTGVWRLGTEFFQKFMEKNPRMAGNASRRLCTHLQTLIGGHGHNIMTTGHLAIAIFATDSPESQKLSEELLQSIARQRMDGKILVINTLPNLYSGQKPARSLQSARPKLVADAHETYQINLKDLESGTEINKISVWLRKQATEYKHIVFLTRSGDQEFRKFIMGMAERTITIIQNGSPEFLKYLKAGRDRVYQLVGSSPESDHALHLDVPTDALMPMIIKPQGLDIAGAQMARWFCHRSVGIAFGGGGARALSQLGVMEILEKTGLIPDMISGTSAGAHMGGLLATGMNIDDILNYFREHAFGKKTHPFSDYTVPIRSLIRGKKYHRLLREGFDNRFSYETVIPFYPCTTDMNKGTEVYLHNMLLKDAILASGSVPGVFPLYEANGTYFGDGGLVNNIPASVLKKYQTDFIISLNSSTDPGQGTFKSPTFFSTVMQMVDILMLENMKNHLEFTDFEIKPDINAFSGTDYKKAAQLIEQGKKTALRVLPQLERAMNRKGIRIEY